MKWLHFPITTGCKRNEPEPQRVSIVRSYTAKLCLNIWKNQQYNILTVAASLHYRHGWKIIQGYAKWRQFKLWIAFSSFSQCLRCRICSVNIFLQYFSDGIAGFVELSHTLMHVTRLCLLKRSTWMLAPAVNVKTNQIENLLENCIFVDYIISNIWKTNIYFNVNILRVYFLPFSFRLVSIRFSRSVCVAYRKIRPNVIISNM